MFVNLMIIPVENLRRRAQGAITSSFNIFIDTLRRM